MKTGRSLRYKQSERLDLILARSAALYALQVLSCGLFVSIPAVVADKDLGLDLDLGILGNQLGRDRNALVDLNAGCDNGVVLHVAHADEFVDASYWRKNRKFLI